jgi:hypothetical protein
LNIYAWLSDERERANCRPTLVNAIQDAEKAIELYARHGERDRDLIGANYNNLAYFWSCEFDAAPSSPNAETNIRSSLETLHRLEETVSRDIWIPKHPEYFHTAAYVYFQEYTFMKSRGNNESDLVSKLLAAKENIDSALRLFQMTTRPSAYRSLKKSINRELKRYHRPA